MTARTVDVDALLNQCRVKLVGASDAQLKAEVFDTLREFFIDSNAWVESIAVPIVADTQDYTVIPTAGFIVRLAGVVDENGIAQPADFGDYGILHFRNSYNNTATFYAYVVLTVARPTDKDGIPEFPDWVLPLWHDTVLNGVLGRMMQSPNKSYSDPKAGMIHEAKFKNGVAAARVAANQRRTIGMSSWRYPQTFATRSQRGGVSIGSDLRFET